MWHLVIRLQWAWISFHYRRIRSACRNVNARFSRFRRKEKKTYCHLERVGRRFVPTETFAYEAKWTLIIRIRLVQVASFKSPAIVLHLSEGRSEVARLSPMSPRTFPRPSFSWISPGWNHQRGRSNPFLGPSLSRQVQIDVQSDRSA